MPPGVFGRYAAMKTKKKIGGKIAACALLLYALLSIFVLSVSKLCYERSPIPILMFSNRRGLYCSYHFTESGFRNIKPGMSVPEVNKILGEPLEIRDKSADGRVCAGKIRVWGALHDVYPGPGCARPAGCKTETSEWIYAKPRPESEGLPPRVVVFRDNIVKEVR